MLIILHRGGYGYFPEIHITLMNGRKKSSNSAGKATFLQDRNYTYTTANLRVSPLRVLIGY